MHFCQSLQGFVVCLVFFFEHCAATTLACCRFSRDGFAKKICSPSQGCTISWGNTTDTKGLHFILLYKSNEFDVSWVLTWVRMGPQLHSTFIGEFIGFGFDPKAL